MTPHRGTCLCGAIRYEVTGPLRDSIACHCAQCRKTSGHYWSATQVPLAQFRLIHAEGLVWFQSSDSARRGFCKHCGASLFWEPTEGEVISIGSGTLDLPTGLTTSQHIFTEDKGDYYVIPESELG